MKKLLKATFLILSILTYHLSFGQTSSVEEKVLPLDTLQVIEEIKVALSFNSANFEKKIYHAQKALDMAKSLGFNRGIIRSTKILGRGHEHGGNLETALTYYEQALKEAKEVNLQSLAAETYSHIGNIYNIQGKRDVSIEYYQKGLSLATTIKDYSAMAGNLLNIAIIYSNQGDPDKAIKYLQEALDITPEDNPIMVSQIQINLGVQYGIKEDYEKARFHFQKSMDIAERLDLKDLVTRLLNNIGQSYLLENKLSLAEDYLKRATQINRELGMNKSLMYSINDLAEVALRKGDYTKADLYFKESLKIAEEMGLMLFQETTHLQMANNYSLMGNYRKAFESQQQYIILNDSLFNETKTKKILELTTKYETEKKEAENQLLKEKEARTNVELERQTIIAWVVGLISLLISLLAFVLYRSNQQKKLYNEQLEKEVQLLNENLENKKIIEVQSLKLQQAEEQKNKLFANIAHELQTPLTLISSPIDNLLSKGGRAEDDQKDLESVANYSNQLLNLTQQILDVVRNKFDELKLNSFTFNLDELLNYLQHEFTDKAKKQGLDLKFIHEMDTNKTIVTDVEKLLTVLKNLIINAIKYSKTEGSITVTSSMNNELLKFVVSDTGQGISADNLTHIFDKYYQSNEANTLLGGMGLGLSICKDYLELLGGSISVKSIENEGSDFTIELPVKALSDFSSNETPSLYKFPKVYNTLPLSLLPKIGNDFLPDDYILIVEDNHDLCHHLHDILKKDYSLAFAHDGKEALQQIEKKTPKAIITDWMMKGMDGKELITNLKSKERFASIPTLMLTARNQAKDRLSMLRIGLDNYLTKPFVPESLKAQVNHLVELAEVRKTAAIENKENPELNKPEIEFLKNLEEITKKNISNFDFQLADMSENLQMGIRQLNRKIKKITGLTPMQYVNEVRFQEAKTMLENREYTTVKAVIYSVGFKSEKNFSRNFKKRFGKYPKEILY